MSSRIETETEFNIKLHTGTMEHDTKIKIN